MATSPTLALSPTSQHEMDADERGQVVAATRQALALLPGSKKAHKKGVVALIKLTGRKEYAELAGTTWLGDGASESGAAMTVDFLQNCNLEDENLHELIEEHLRLVANVLRVDGLLRRLVELKVVAALMKVLTSCPVSALVARALRGIGLVSVDSTAMMQLVEANAMGEIMNRVSIKDDVFLTSVLPRLLKDGRMAKLFCENGGVGFLQGVLVFEEESSPQAVAGAVAAVSVLSKTPELMQRLIAEEDFVACFVQLLSSKKLELKTKVHVVQALYLIAQDATGFTLAETAVLPLMEIIEDRGPEALAAIVASFNLLGLLCNTTDAIAAVEQYGGEGFVSYLCCFLASPKQAVVEPLCGLLHVLALGSHREVIVTAVSKACATSPLKELLTATLDLMGGNARSKKRSETIAATAAVIRRDSQLAPVEDLGVVERPQRRNTRESQTARQGAKRGNIMKEILSTERTYSVALFSVCKCFIDPLKKLAAQPKPLVSAAEMEVLFGNIGAIYELHKNFLKRFDQRVKQSAQPNIADLFSTFADSIVDVYRSYYDNYPKAVALVAEKEKKTKGFRQLCTDLAKKIVHGGMSLENYLIMPIQRLPRYVMLLAELDKATVDVHPDKAALGAAAKKLEEKLAVLDSGEPAPRASGTAAPTRNAVPVGAFSSVRGLPKPKGNTLEARSSTVSSFGSPVLQMNYSEPPAQLKVVTRKSRVVSGAARGKTRQSRESMIFQSPTKDLAPEDVPPPYSAPNPIVSEGIVFEEHGRDEHSVRKLVLLRDKLVVMTCPGVDADDPAVFWDSQDPQPALPATVFSFPLQYVRIEKESRFGMRLFDTRKPDEPGVLLSCETEQICNAWCDVIFEQIYA